MKDRIFLRLARAKPEISRGLPTGVPLPFTTTSPAFKPALSAGVFAFTVRTRTPSLTPKNSANCGLSVSPSKPIKAGLPGEYRKRTTTGQAR